jgi:hypothetical protein
MDITSVLAWLQGSAIAGRIRDSLYIFPFLESAHVVGLAVVVGTISVIDLRLLGVASVERSFARMASDILKWTWSAFLLTFITGALMFITNADVYFHNTPFRIKMALLAAAGLNTLVFELTAAKAIRQWDKAPSAPPIGKVAATLSLVLWISVIFAGRIIGFTTTARAKVEPVPAGVNLDDLLGGAK